MENNPEVYTSGDVFHENFWWGGGHCGSSCYFPGTVLAAFFPKGIATRLLREYSEPIIGRRDIFGIPLLSLVSMLSVALIGP